MLLIFSFPNFNQPWCAWIALVPWLRLLRTVGARAAWWWSSLIGFLFFLASIWWLVYVTVVGWVVLCAFLALYFGLFGVVAVWARPKHHVPSPSDLVVLPSAWVALEYLRSHCLSGFGWNLLAYSQTPYLPLIQVADLTGAWGVSWMVVLVNAAIAAWIHGRLAGPGGQARGKRTARSAGRAVAVALAVGLGSAGYGMWRMPRVVSGSSLRVAVVQGNIPQAVKWDEAHQGAILDQYEALTRSAARREPDLIVWPETSVPGYLGAEEEVTRRLAQVAQTVGRPLLVGAPMLRVQRERSELSNSAVLLDGAGTITARYDKLHLVPFGEYLPLERHLPWLRHLLPIVGDFSPGHDYTVFDLPPALGQETRDRGRATQPLSQASRPMSRVSVLICFEDLFPQMARRFVHEGATVLLVITNDAWFGPTAAAYQHVQASTLRAVELRVPVARAANTGWSGSIDPAGRWGSRVRGPSGDELFVEGTVTCDLPLGVADSLYLRWGDWFALLCLLLTLCVLCRLNFPSRLPYNHTIV